MAVPQACAAVLSILQLESEQTRDGVQIGVWEEWGEEGSCIPFLSCSPFFFLSDYGFQEPHRPAGTMFV